MVNNRRASVPNQIGDTCTTNQKPMNTFALTTIAVGSTNPVKIAAVRNVVQRIWPAATVRGVEVAPGVSIQPLTDEEAIAGATNRAHAALAAATADLGVGVEGNTVDTANGMFTTAWVVVVAQDGVSSLGSSGRLLLPPAIAQAIRHGAELGPLMDQVAGEVNTKQRQGAVGILTHGLLTREQALETAVTYALARLVAPHFYGM
jgi:inosine/xanthosine triphosphatase